MRAEEEKEYYIRYRPKFAMGYLLEGTIILEAVEEYCASMSARLCLCSSKSIEELSRNPRSAKHILLTYVLTKWLFVRCAVQIL